MAVFVGNLSCIKGALAERVLYHCIAFLADFLNIYSPNMLFDYSFSSKGKYVTLMLKHIYSVQHVAATSVL